LEGVGGTNFKDHHGTCPEDGAVFNTSSPVLIRGGYLVNINEAGAKESGCWGRERERDGKSPNSTPEDSLTLTLWQRTWFTGNGGSCTLCLLCAKDAGEWGGERGHTKMMQTQTLQCLEFWRGILLYNV
jgi:hypothetical protein